MLTISTAPIAAILFQAAAYYAFPMLLWIAVTRRLGVSWRFVGLGSLSWLTALPAIMGAPTVVGWLLRGSTTVQQTIGVAAALAVTAGLAEETSRYG